jgi:hypothetical protein
MESAKSKLALGYEPEVKYSVVMRNGYFKKLTGCKDG